MINFFKNIFSLQKTEIEVGKKPSIGKAKITKFPKVSQTPNQLFIPPNSINYGTFGQSFLDIGNGKIIIFGLPKAGNAWLQSMLVKYFDSAAILSVDDVEMQGILSIHDPFEKYMLYRSDFANGVCLIRDIRDVIVSYYRYGKTSEFRRVMTRFLYDDFDSFYYEWFLSRCVPSHRLHTFADEYAVRGVPILRYERLQANPVSELARLLARWGFSPDYERIKDVVNIHQLAKLQNKGLDLGYWVEPSHFRKGGWGNFLDEMPLSILEDVNWRFEQFLRRWGYPLSLSDTSITRYRQYLLAIAKESQETNVNA